jgi:hypothetical protein
VLEVDGDEVLASGDGDGVVDAMRMETTNSNPWSVTGISSGGDSERRLEVIRRRFASVDDACIDSLRNWTDKVHQRECRDERER